MFQLYLFSKTLKMEKIIQAVENMVQQKKQDVFYLEEEKERTESRIQKAKSEIAGLEWELAQLKQYNFDGE